MADPLTNWVDGRIQVGVRAAVDAALEHQDAVIAKFAAQFRAAVVGDFSQLGDKVAALPNLVSQVEGAGLHALESIPQQVAVQVENVVATLPSTIAQAIGNLFPHFLRHLADLPPTERDMLLTQYAGRAVDPPADDPPEQRKQIREPES